MLTPARDRRPATGATGVGGGKAKPSSTPRWAKGPRARGEVSRSPLLEPGDDGVFVTLEGADTNEDAREV